VKDFMLTSENPVISSSSLFRLPKETIGDLDAETAARLVAASSDVAMVIDRDGIIRDIAVSGSDMPTDGFSDIIERRWVDTVANDSRRKVEEILSDASAHRESRWREVNQQSASGSIPLRYMAVDFGRDGRVIALGHDLRAGQAMQQRILQAQQSMERDYVKLRQAESRYRVLFQMASEAVLIVDPVSKKIVEANPAAGNLLGADYSSLAGQAFGKLFHPDSRDLAGALLVDQTTRPEPISVRLADGRQGYQASAALFRQDGSAHALISLSAGANEPSLPEDEAKQRLLRVLNRIPDAFVITDETMNILDVNLAFLELSQLPSADAAKGESLARFLGRPGVDLRVLTRNLREHGWVRNFGTVIRTVHGDQEEVDLSAVSVLTGLEATHGFVIRPVRRAVPPPSARQEQLPRTAEELTQLVGRISLREIVAETTDVIERMCIKSALNLTGNNRASAAEILGLSRQSLYSKLSRHGLGGSDNDLGEDH